MASHLLNHSSKMRNASKLLHHERALLVRWFSGDAQSSLNRNRGTLPMGWRYKVSWMVEGEGKRGKMCGKLNSTSLQQQEVSLNRPPALIRETSPWLPLKEVPLSGLGSMEKFREYVLDEQPGENIPWGNIARWLKKEGDKISPGEVLCEVETDKATVEMECMEEGYLAKIIRGDGAKEIKVGEVIAVTVEDEGDIAKFKDYQPSASEPSAAPAKEISAPPTPKKEEEVEEPGREPEPKVSKPSAPPSSGDRTFASPLARKLGEEKNVPLSSIKGTGPEGLIVKADIDDYLASGAKEVSASSKAKVATDAALDYTDIPVSQIRKVTASRLLLSKQTIPHYYLTVDTCVDKLTSLRTQLNSLQEASGGSRISVNDLVIKAAALALRKVPQCNSSWANDYIRQYNNVNINVAVQTDNGLFVPVIRDADKKGLSTIGEEVKQLAKKAKENSLKPQDYEGGTFTVSNLGGPFGVRQFCAIINPPQAGILAVGSSERRVVPGSGAEEFKFASFMSVTLSCDHRVIDGAIGAEWLKAFKGYIENPETMLL
ncbi:hypothetical protein JHK87_017389 [Glycine soja]|nr:hypothetical protein JHK87_017389 [Glycine soja]